MKKIIASVFLMMCVGILNASDIEFKGIITSVDNAKKTISVNNTLIQILPQTKVKLDDCGIFGTDLIGKFSDLKVNSFVEVDAFPNNAAMVGSYATQDAGKSGAPLYIAEEVELKCVKNSAY